MTNFFKWMSLPVKLMLIGIVPLIFFVYLSVQLYNEKSQKIRLLDSYIAKIRWSSDLSKLINNLQIERKYSFDYSLNKTMQEQLLRQRPVTDSFLQKMSYYDESIKDFSSYTFLDNLTKVRNAIDSGFMKPGIVMDYYSSTIYRLNTLNALPAGSNIYLQPVYKDLVAQKLLSEIITFLGIMSANIYNALYTRQYMVEILIGTAGTYRVYKTYDTEFLLKASPDAVLLYNSVRSVKSLSQTNGYLDKVFKTFSFDSLYSHEEWERVSTTAVDKLRDLQQKLLQKVEAKVTAIFKSEQTAKKQTLIFLVFSLLFVTGIVFYTAYSISETLKELKEAAQRISVGAPSISITARTDDVIGSLAKSIAAIDKNNKQLADAAHAIGKGQFDVPVQPRSGEDILGNAIVDMKASLQKSTAKLTASNEELERFAYVASHDLQEPLRMVSSFLNLLEEEYGKELNETAREYIHYAVDGAGRMKILVNDLLQYSRVGANKEEFTATDLNETIGYVIRVLEEDIRKRNAVLKIQSLPVIMADKILVGQLFINLLGNALKYHGEKQPEIEVGYTEEQHRFIFYVKDNGIGIDPKFFDKIFIIFQRLHSKGEYHGTGIGLAICKKIVDIHKGKIWVESGEGKGSTFYFSILKK